MAEPLPITFQMVATAVPIVVLILTIWWKVEGRIDNAKARAQTVADEFAIYRTHVAETYVSKSGLREVRDEIMGALDKVGGNLDRINDRIDRVADKPAPVPRTRRAAGD